MTKFLWDPMLQRPNFPQSPPNRNLKSRTLPSFSRAALPKTCLNLESRTTFILATQALRGPGICAHYSASARAKGCVHRAHCKTLGAFLK